MSGESLTYQVRFMSTARSCTSRLPSQQYCQVSGALKIAPYGSTPICINQANLTERAHQVTIMKKIYSSCKRAVAWIGPTPGTIRKRREHETDLPEDWLAFDEAQVTRAMEVMKDILAWDAHTLHSIKEEFMRKHGDVEHTSPHGYTQTIASPERKALMFFLQDIPYWSRICVFKSYHSRHKSPSSHLNMREC